ncbi:serine hydrolase domain-containing protein [Prevotella sp.]|uniref:serine hydrolase domain-containing protein n=1 Tax=Prevotella sp. TaxID=59823 RepID=UPI002A809C70|nr:serine hydrolase domain-containing protein [Prevotella sp.]MDY4645171.1 serine hydrolase domain-containing protein [Prevotella sp.]
MFGYRIKKQYRTKVRLSCLGCLTFIVVIISSICRCTCSSCSSDKSREKDSIYEASNRKHLNDTLTNAMSSQPELHAMDSIMQSYLKRWEIHGAQLAISRHDSLLYARGFGYADKDRQIPMEPSYIMRMASVSKLVTATGIMKLRDMGKIRLSDKVFGPKGILNDTFYVNSIRDKRYFDITVEQLLRHKAGFTNYAGDAIFSTRYIMQQNHLTTPPDHRTLLRIVLRRHLGYTPGTAQRYCNIGYTLLSLIIEKRTGMSYENFMQRYVLNPAGCYDFHIAGNYLKDRRKNETVYYMHSSSVPVPEFNNSGRMVVRCYGENDITTALGAGAWVASAAELCRLVASIDGDRTVPDVISPQAVKLMTQEMPDHQFSLGWNFTPRNRPWIRTGSLVGTSALVLRYPDGECWVFITNTSTWKGHKFSQDTMALFEKLRKRFGSKMPKRNMFIN